MVNRHLRTVGFFGLVMAGVAAIACSSNAPLGGPYGGQSFHVRPTDGGFSNVDATIAPKPPAAADGQGALGTWPGLFNRYLKANTPGNCTTCHSEMDTPEHAYEYLQADGYVGGRDPLLTSDGASCLTWFGGDMPPGAPLANADAVSEFTQWAAAGGTSN